jgi:hypothetical protein
MSNFMRTLQGTLTKKRAQIFREKNHLRHSLISPQQVPARDVQLQSLSTNEQLRKTSAEAIDIVAQEKALTGIRSIKVFPRTARISPISLIPLFFLELDTSFVPAKTLLKHAMTKRIRIDKFQITM